MSNNLQRGALGVACAALLAGSASAAIDTQSLDRPWPKQYTHTYEIGRTPVVWRHRVSKKDGLWTGARFVAPRPRNQVWALSNDYSDLGKMTPGVKAVRIRQQGERRRVVEVDMKILWKAFTFTFEFEEDPPNAIRFRWHDARFGEYIGIATFAEAAAKPGEPVTQTEVELSTRFEPNGAAPLRLLLGVERMAMLSATRDFLKSCEKAPVN